MSKQKQPRRLAENEAQAVLRTVRTSPQKAGLVLDMIKGKKVEDALAALTFSPKKTAKLAKGVLESAIANAENNHGLDVDNLVVIKEASGDVRRITDLFNALGDRYKIFSGVDDVALESIMLGCTGWVSGLVDAFPRENRLMWDAAIAKDYERARVIYRWYMPMLQFDSHPKLVQYIKLTCQELGYGHERTRPPRLPLVGEEREHVLGIVRNCVATRPKEVAPAHV